MKVTANKKEVFVTYSEFSKLNKTPFLISKLVLAEKGVGSLKSYDPNNIKNIVLFNIETKKSKWIFPTNDNYIYYDQKDIHEDENEECCDIDKGKSKILGLIIQLADKDTNDDKKIDEDDKTKLVHLNLNTTDNFNIVDAVDKVFSIKRISKEEYGIFYMKEMKSFYKSYNFVNQKISEEVTL